MPKPRHMLIRKLDHAGDLLDGVQMELAFPHRSVRERQLAIEAEAISLRVRLLRKSLRDLGARVSREQMIPQPE